MRLINKYAGSALQNLNNYYCELTEFLDKVTEKKRPSIRHYILAMQYNFDKGVFPIRLPGSTVGEVHVNEDQVITNVQIDGNYYKDIYPADINEMLEKYLGEKMVIKQF